MSDNGRDPSGDGRGGMGDNSTDLNEGLGPAGAGLYGSLVSASRDRVKAGGGGPCHTLVAPSGESSELRSQPVERAVMMRTRVRRAESALPPPLASDTQKRTTRPPGLRGGQVQWEVECPPRPWSWWRAR